MAHTATATRYYTVAGWMPGYMPNDDDPRAFPFSQALSVMADDLRRVGDDLLERSQLENYSSGESYYSLDEMEQLDREADRVHRMADALEKAATALETEPRRPSTVTLEGEPYPLDYVEAHGLSVHIETEPDSVHHLGWTVGLSPLEPGLIVCPVCGQIAEPLRVGDRVAVASGSSTRRVQVTEVMDVDRWLVQFGPGEIDVEAGAGSNWKLDCLECGADLVVSS